MHLKEFMSMVGGNDSNGKPRPVRVLVEQAMHPELTGDQAKGKELLTAAQRTDSAKNL
jgi:hypothetical protein